jgi:hypothetical protein
MGGVNAGFREIPKITPTLAKRIAGYCPASKKPI